MDDMAAYYAQNQPPNLLSYQYYPPPPPQPPPPLTFVPPPPGAPLPPAHHLHQPYHPQHPQPHVYGSYAPPLSSPPHLSSTNDVRTLFIAGLPEDVKPREIYNLFREFPGYESSHLRSPNGSSQAFAFAIFTNQQSAIMALHALNGMVFDLEKGSTLYIDLAKSNSRAKRGRIDDERAGSDKKARGSAPSRPTPDSGVSSIHMPGIGNPAFNTNMIGYPPAQSYGNADGNALHDNLFPHLKKCATPYIPTNTTPCATLFVANLGPSCNEQELIQVFSRFPGFLKLKMQSTYGAPVSFVDFKDIPSATATLNGLQGTILYSSPAGEGMRLEYAKSRMGMRRKPK